MFFGAFWRFVPLWGGAPKDNFHENYLFFLSDQAEIQHTGSTFQVKKEYLIFRLIGGDFFAVFWRFGPLWGGAPKDYFHGNNLFFLSDQAEIQHTGSTFQAEKEYLIFRGG